MEKGESRSEPVDVSTDFEIERRVEMEGSSENEYV